MYSKRKKNSFTDLLLRDICDETNKAARTEEKQRKDTKKEGEAINYLHSALSYSS